MVFLLVQCQFLQHTTSCSLTEDVHSYTFQVSSKVVAVAEETCFGRDSKFWLLVKSQNFKQLRDISLTPFN